LIVIAVMAILASLVIPITGAVNKQKIRSRAKGEMNQLESGIDAYKAKYGFYPPDNPGYPAMNQLFYELMGTIPTNNPTTAGGSAYVTLDGSTRIVNVTAAFSGVTGFMNCSRGGGGDEAKSAKNFLASGLKPGQYMALASPPNPVVCTVLGSSLDGPLTYPGSPSGKINPWRYVSTNPTNNPNSYDLWIDVLVGGKTNRICNWSTEPLIL